MNWIVVDSDCFDYYSVNIAAADFVVAGSYFAVGPNSTVGICFDFVGFDNCFGNIVGNYFVSFDNFDCKILGFFHSGLDFWRISSKVRGKK